MTSLFESFKSWFTPAKAESSRYDKSVSDKKTAAEKTLGAYCQLGDLVRWKGAARHFNISKRRIAVRRTAGPHRSPSRGRGMEFEDVRQYQAGDDIRHIDWRVSARLGKTHTKQFREEREIPILLALDQRQSMFFGSQTCMKSVMACDIVSLLAWSGLQNGDRLGGIVFENTQHHEIRPKKSRATVLHFLNQCVTANQSLNTQSVDEAQPSDTYSLADMLGEIKRLAKPGFQIFIVSDFSDFNESCLPLLRDINLHCECTALQITDPLEAALNSGSDEAFSQSQAIHTGSSSLVIHPQDKRWQSHYQDAFIQHQNNIEQALASFHIPLIQLSSNDEPAAVLQRYFARR